MSILKSAALLGLLALTACSDEATVASRNLSKEADMFRVPRRIVFINTMTDKYILAVEGRCSITVDKKDNQLEVICKTESGEFLKTFLGLSANVVYTVEQLQASTVSAHQYKVIFMPETIVPTFEVATSVSQPVPSQPASAR